MLHEWRSDLAWRDRIASHVREPSLARLATAQYGVIAHRQLLDLGWSPAAVGRLMDATRLQPLHPGVYAVGHGALHPRARWMAATLAGGEGAALSHRPAGAIQDLVGIPAGRIDVTTPSVRGRTDPSLRIHTRDLPPDDLTVVDRIPCTAPARTLLDLATVLRPPALLEACEQSLRTKAFDLAAVADLLDRCYGQRGTRRLCTAIAALEDEPAMLRSELERRLRALVLSSSLPSGRHNHHLPGTSGRLWECDLVWPHQRLVVEADGRAYHSTRAARERDARKQADLEAAGWTVIRLTWADVVHRPGETIARLAAVMRT